ncbi:MAG: hypothetical protein IT250_01285 [Chitinophagaceae bacterium]|nr:hypothetical protein [Chitinophagaceae bacterium]
MQNNLRNSVRFLPAGEYSIVPDAGKTAASGVVSDRYSLDKSTETAYLRLSDAQDRQELAATHFRKIVQLPGGKDNNTGFASYGLMCKPGALCFY